MQIGEVEILTPEPATMGLLLLGALASSGNAAPGSTH